MGLGSSSQPLQAGPSCSSIVGNSRCLCGDCMRMGLADASGPKPSATHRVGDNFLPVRAGVRGDARARVASISSAFAYRAAYDGVPVHRC